MKMNRKISGFAFVASLGLAGAVQAAAINFDADGTGGNAGTVLTNTFGWDTGNALAVGGNAAVQTFLATNGQVQTPFTLLYHTRMVSLTDPNSVDVTPTGLNNTYEITVVTGFREIVTDVTPGNLVSFGSPVADPNPLNFFEIYFDTTPDSNFLAGTGFNDGQLIASGTVDVRNSFFGILDNIPPHEALDQAGPQGPTQDNYLGQQTVSGIGVTQITAEAVIATVDFDFFKDAPLSLLFDAFTANQAIPFKNVDPSAAFVFGPGGVAETTAGAGLFGTDPDNFLALGKVNGLLPIAPGGGGSSIQFEARAQNTFQLVPGVVDVPEPSTLALGGLGIAGLLAGRRRRQA